MTTPTQANPAASTPHTPSPDDIFVWADGTYCYRCEVGEFASMSDDYTTLYVDSPAWLRFGESDALGNQW